MKHFATKKKSQEPNNQINIVKRVIVQAVKRNTESGTDK